MSPSSRPWSRGLAPRRRRSISLAPPVRLEDRCLLAPVLATVIPTVTATTPTITPAPPAGTQIQDIAITPIALPSSPAPITSVSLLTPDSAFGGDLVRIKAGPGGDFGKGVYAISRGAGANAPLGAVNRPGVIYRVDPATGKSSVFFDLNTVISNLEPGTGATAANSLGASTGLVNWYDIEFDPEGYFDGRPSMFVSTSDRADPLKNAVYRVAPDGTFLGAFAVFTEGQSALNLTQNPTAVYIPPPEQQSFLRGLFVGDGSATASGTGGDVTNINLNFTGLFFDANVYPPGQNVGATLPTGVTPTFFNAGPQLGFASTSFVYPSPVYSVFTDFGTPTGGGIAGQPGASGVQGLGGEFLINNGAFPTPLTPPPATVDLYPFIRSDFRRFTDIAYDHYGYFAYGFATAVATGTTGGASTATFDYSSPTYGGNLFVADLAPGLAVAINPGALAGGTAPAATIAPVLGPGRITAVTQPDGTIAVTNTTGGLGGRIVRIDQLGVVTPFATGFRVTEAFDGSSLATSDLSISFSADGTTLYAADLDGIWQFKSVASLAYSQTGQVIGLGDLRTLGVPYEGQDQAVQIIDTGVSAITPPLRGRVSSGVNILTNGFGDDDLTAGTFAGTNTGGGTTGSNIAGGPTFNLVNGHGTPLAGVVAQFVPQATLSPVSVASPFFQGSTTNSVGVALNSNAITTNQALYDAFQYVADNPYVRDPVRPGKLDRVVTAVTGIGTVETFDSEGTAYRKNKMLVIAFKNQLKKLRDLGIAPIAAAGQLGIPVGNSVTNGGGFGSGNPNNVTGTGGDINGISLPAVLNEVTSVSGTYAFPFQEAAGTPPTDPPIGVHPRPIGPLLLFLGSTGSVRNTGPLGGTTQGGTGATGNLFINNPAALSAISGGDGQSGNNNNQGGGSSSGLYFNDKVIAAVNRNRTLDFVAPAVNIPTFRRVNANPATNAAATIGPGDVFNVFQEAGTSLSAGITAGAYSVVASALDYWADLNRVGTTADAYLTQPVGARTLTYGPHAFKDLSSYANPDGINAILQWTAVPVVDENIQNDAVTQKPLIGSTDQPEYSRVDIGNAIAAIEGQEALQYLLDRGLLSVIDSNNNGLITAQEIQTFVDQANVTGQAEAGSMARLLGGNARPVDQGVTAGGETPDDPDVLQRRFNFFDYAADGKLNGAISIDQLRVLAGTLLPRPDAFVVVDRQRASANGYLLDPSAHRNYQDLQHILPQYEFVPPQTVARYRNISPARFHLNRGLNPASQTPFYTIFNAQAANLEAMKQARAAQAAAQAAGGTQTGGGTQTSGNTQTGGGSQTGGSQSGGTGLKLNGSQSGGTGLKLNGSQTGGTGLKLAATQTGDPQATTAPEQATPNGNAAVLPLVDMLTAQANKKKDATTS